MSQPELEPPRLERTFGAWDGLAIIVGVVIGAGILGTPGLIAGYLGHPLLILGIWLFGGISVALTALVLAELGAMIPAAGGKYAFVREAYGPVAGCFAGWAEVVFNRSIIGAVKAALIGQYAVLLLGFGSARVVACGATVFFLILHLGGVRVGRLVQNASTAAKLLLLLGIAGAGLLLGDGAGWHAGGAAAPGTGLLLGFALASQSVFFTYYGAEAGLQVAEEIRAPGRNIPRMLLFGVAAVTLLYLLINVAFLNTLTSAAMAGSKLVARDVLAHALGPRAGAAVAIVALGILFSSLNYNFLGTPRVPFGLARDGLAPALFARLNARGTPTAGLFLAGALIFLFAATGTFEMLVRLVSFMTLAVDGLVLSSLFALRRKAPHADRPFRVPLYPLVPAAALLSYATMFTIVIVTQPRLALSGAVVLGLTGAGTWLLTPRLRRPPTVEAPSMAE